MDISFYCFLWRLISVRRVRASNGRQNRFLYRSHRNGQSRKNIVFMRLCGVSGIHFLRRGEQIILLFFITFKKAGRKYFIILPPCALFYTTLFTACFSFHSRNSLCPSSLSKNFCISGSRTFARASTFRLLLYYFYGAAFGPLHFLYKRPGHSPCHTGAVDLERRS